MPEAGLQARMTCLNEVGAVPIRPAKPAHDLVAGLLHVRLKWLGLSVLFSRAMSLGVKPGC